MSTKGKYMLSIGQVFEKLKEVATLNGTSTDTLYIEMHIQALEDLMRDPDLDAYIHFSRPTITAETMERLLGARIFTHHDDLRRFVLTITYKTDFLVGEKRG